MFCLGVCVRVLGVLGWGEQGVGGMNEQSLYRLSEIALD